MSSCPILAAARSRPANGSQPELYLKLNADRLKPYTIRLIKRDSKAPNGAAAKIDAQELLTRDKVDVLAGWTYSPDAIASASVVTAGKKLAIIMNAGTAFITNLSPYFVRTSFTLWQSSYVWVRWLPRDCMRKPP